MIAGGVDIASWALGSELLITVISLFVRHARPASPFSESPVVAQRLEIGQNAVDL